MATAFWMAVQEASFDLIIWAQYQQYFLQKFCKIERHVYAYHLNTYSQS